jgi:phosphatidylglycerol:prolipoprotein diacylglycerol transferase
MFPTMFTIPFLPAWLADVKSYGVMMMIAFLTGIWMACRRAMRSQANPDTVLNMGFIALVAGIAGARAMFVIHYWDTRFANQANPLAAVFDIRAGGLEFWGGPILVVPALIIYLRYIAKVSVRWYLDICAASLAWGLAVTRIGCFLNGCCWGATCVDEHDPARHKASIPWAVHFPYGSPAMVQQFRFGQLTIPKELICMASSGESFPIPREYIEAALGDKGRTHDKLSQDFDAARTDHLTLQTAQADEATLAAARQRMQDARKALDQFNLGNSEISLVHTQCQRYGLTPQELLTLSHSYEAKPAHPTQLYEMISGMLICWLLVRMFYYRTRHGIVLPWFLILYSISRVLLESIRQDNPLDVGGVTISQAVSFATFLTGVAWLWFTYRHMPLRSTRAVPFVFPDEPQATRKLA